MSTLWNWFLGLFGSGGSEGAGVIETDSLSDGTGGEDE